MADYWAENLRLAAIEGIEIDVASRQISGGHEFGRHRPQNTPGQDTEPTGRSPLVISIEVPLYASVNPAHYPLLYTQLLDVLTDETTGGRVTYVDPVFGELAMQIATWSTSEQSEHRNGATVKITLEERTREGVSFAAPIAVPRPAAQATARGRRLDMSLPGLGVFDEHIFAACVRSGYPLSGAELAYPVGGVLAGMAQTAIDAFTLAQATIDDVRGIVDAVRARTDALLSLGQLAAAEAWDTRAALVSYCDAIGQAGKEALGRRGVETVFTPASDTTAQSIAAEVYGDSTRWPDVVATNGSIRNPLRVQRGPMRVFLPARGRNPGLRA